MKAVVIYTRVSSDEQVHRYSLSDQEERLTDYCHRNSFVIAAKFQDDHTAKTFDRPGFKQMLTFLKTNKVDEIIFIKWTRFSRVLSDALIMIERLKIMGVSVQAIDEPIDFDVPQSYLLVLPVYIGIGQADNVVKADLVTRGIRRAKTQGKWVNRAPLGYMNKRDEKNKPYLVIDESKAPLVKEMFELMATGDYSQDQVRKQIWKQGLKIAKSRISIMMKNPVYCGNIYIESYKKEHAQTVKGIHQPIISEPLFYRVQEVIKEHRRVKVKKYRKMSDQFPLNGFLYCDNEHRMTFSHSRGRHGGVFAYYHCANHLHCARCRAAEVNTSFIEHLGTFKADERRVAHFRMIYEALTKQENNTHVIQRTISQQEQRIEILQDKFVDGHIQDGDYQQMRSRYESELFNLKAKITFITEQQKQSNQNIELSTKLLSNLQEYYCNATTEGKREVIICLITSTGRILFDVETKKCRTPVLDPLIAMMYKTDNAFRAGKIFSLPQYEETSLSVAGKEHMVEPYQLHLSIQRLAQTYKLLTKTA